METTTILLIALPVLVVLAGCRCCSRRLADATPVRSSARSPARPASATAVRSPRPTSGDAVTGREVEAAAALERVEASRAVATIDAKPPVAWVPPDPEVLGVTRRQFFNRGIVGFFVLGPLGLRRCLPRLPVAEARRRLRLGDQPRQHRVDRRQDRRGPAASPTTPRAACGSPSTPPPRSRQRPPDLQRRAARHGGRLHGALPEVRAPRLPRARVQDLAVVRVPVPRLAVQPQPARRRAARHRAASIASRSPSAARNISVDTGTIITGPPIGTNTTGQEAEGPHCVGGGH